MQEYRLCGLPRDKKMTSLTIWSARRGRKICRSTKGVLPGTAKRATQNPSRKKQFYCMRWRRLNCCEVERLWNPFKCSLKSQAQDSRMLLRCERCETKSEPAKLSFDRWKDLRGVLMFEVAPVRTHWISELILLTKLHSGQRGRRRWRVLGSTLSLPKRSQYKIEKLYSTGVDCNKI